MTQYNLQGTINMSILFEDVEKPEEILKNLQGNILKSHGRMYNMYIFLRFKPNMQPKVRKWIAGLVKENNKDQVDNIKKYITTAYQQEVDSKAYRSDKNIDGGLFLTLGLAIHGYYYLELPTYPNDEAFIQGMLSKAPCLGDYPDKDFDVPYQHDQNLHAVLLVADDHKNTLNTFKEDLNKEVEGFAEIVTTELGQSKEKKEDNFFTDHFGYTEGISNPEFITPKAQVKPVHYSSLCNLDIVLTPDRSASNSHCFGSYMVFRKLEMHTDVFDFAVQKIGEEISKTEGPVHLEAITQRLSSQKKSKQTTEKSEKQLAAEELAAAYIMGRFKDGTSLIKSGKPENNTDNDFDYKDDPGGAKCPYFSHIRKTNPRNELPESNMYWSKPQIVRRGSNYEEDRENNYGKDGESNSKKERKNKKGLLFVCYQSSIQRQFEKIQVGWANNPVFPSGATGNDPIIGTQIPITHRDCQQIAPSLKWYIDNPINTSEYFFPNKYGQEKTLPPDLDHKHFFNSHLPNFVTPRGGAYFFFPSIPTLKDIEVKDRFFEIQEKGDSKILLPVVWPCAKRVQYIIAKAWDDKETWKNLTHEDPHVSTLEVVRLLKLTMNMNTLIQALPIDQQAWEKKSEKELDELCTLEMDEKYYIIRFPLPEAIHSNDDIASLTLEKFKEYYPPFDSILSKIIELTPFGMMVW